MLSTPLQLAHATATLAMHGKGFKPHLAQQAESVLEPITLKNPAHWQTVIDAMIHVMHAPNGTGKKGGALANTIMAGKTGTAQVVAFAKDAKYNAELLPEEQRDHALFVGFAPAKDPSIAIAVMIENGGSGGGTASPLAGLIVDFWQKRQAQASNP
jgi:penicillin-binding protein 2